MSKKIIIKKPKKNKIGLIPFNNCLLSNNMIELKMTNIFLKKNKYFVTFDKKQNIDQEKQIINYMDENYNLKINDKDIYYFGLRGNVMIYTIMIKNKKDLCDGILNDYSQHDKYSWKTFFNINFENNSHNKEELEKNIFNSLYYLISEKKKQKITFEEIIFHVLNTYKKN